MDSSVKCDSVCKFVWQYEMRKQWHMFSDEEIQHLNESVKQGKSSTSFFFKRNKSEVTIDFNKMVQIQNVTYYERRVRCLVGQSDFNEWCWKNTYNEWISYNPYLAFLLEIAYHKKEKKINHLDYELNLEKYIQVHTKTTDTQPFKRLPVDVLAAEEMIKANESIYKDALSKEFSSLKRSFNSVSPAFSTMNGTVPKKMHKGPLNAKVSDKGILTVNVDLGNMTDSKSISDTPVDKECPIRDNFHVYFEDKPFSATLNQTNLQNNNNKFYFIQLLKHNERNQYQVWRRWGRVGHHGQTNLNNYSTSLSEAKDEFEKKFYDKTRNHWDEVDNFVHVKGKYDLLQINLNPQAVKRKIDVPSKLSLQLKALMELICDTKKMEEIMNEMSYDSKKTPLGELTKHQIKNGYIALNKIATILNKGGSHSALLEACNSFYTKIPHNFGMKTPPIIQTQADIDDKQKMLEALSNIHVAMDVMNSDTNISEHPLDKYYKNLNCFLDYINPDCSEYLAIEKCLHETHGPTHNTYKMEIVSIFRCSKYQEESSFINNDNKLFLWHGSRIINWLGILKQGLRIAPPEAPRTGYMFGKGIYFADVSSKSANYCFPTKKKNEGLLLMSEVSCGKPFPLFEADEKMPENLPKDFDSVLGKGRIHPRDFEIGALSNDAKVPVGDLIEEQEYEGSLQYNEYIVYNAKQVKMRYLLRVKFNFI